MYCAPTNEVLTYHVGDQDRFKQIQRLIEQETKIAVADQEILQMTGVPLDSNTFAHQCCNAVVSWVTSFAYFQKLMCF